MQAKLIIAWSNDVHIKRKREAEWMDDSFLRPAFLIITRTRRRRIFEEESTCVGFVIVVISFAPEAPIHALEMTPDTCLIIPGGLDCSGASPTDNVRAKKTVSSVPATLFSIVIALFIIALPIGHAIEPIVDIAAWKHVCKRLEFGHIDVWFAISTIKSTCKCIRLRVAIAPAVAEGI